MFLWKIKLQVLHIVHESVIRQSNENTKQLNRKCYISHRQIHVITGLLVRLERRRPGGVSEMGLSGDGSGSGAGAATTMGAQVWQNWPQGQAHLDWAGPQARWLRHLAGVGLWEL